MNWLFAQLWFLLAVAFVLGSAAAWFLYRVAPRNARSASRGAR